MKIMIEGHQNAYKSVRITPLDTAQSMVDSLAEKMNLQQIAQHFELSEVIKGVSTSLHHAFFSLVFFH